ncbi:MAG TPA: carboxypeptidase regulatory-like domain-containing protein [Acidobacteriaceae bacterium]|jgi:hypothetical protein
MTQRNERHKQDGSKLRFTTMKALPNAIATMRTTLRATLLFAAVALCAWSNAAAQGSANVDGIVHDVTGALVPKATITLKNIATGKILSTKSNGSGVFSFSGLNTGDYVLDVASTGFMSEEFSGIHLNPGDQRTFREIKLKVGETATVTVTDVQGQLSTDSGETSTLISAEDIDHLAVEGRDVTELLKILPGMAIVQNSTNFANAAYDPSLVSFGGAIGAYSGNGTQTNSTAILSDGMDITDPGSYGLAIQNVNYDQVAEVKVQTGSFTSDTAHGPVVVNAIGKSGGSAFHGSLYTYARTYQLNSLDWQAKYVGSQPPHDRQLYPGFTIGGPVWIPGLGFNRSKKLTFFVGAEEYAQRSVYAYNSPYQATVTAMVPTAKMHKGIFSDDELNAMLGPNRVLNPNYVPNSTAAATAKYYCPNTIYTSICAAAAIGPQGPNVVPPIMNGDISAFGDPLGMALINTLPLPNVPTNGQYNYLQTDFVNNNLYQVKSRLDYALSDKTHAFLSYGVESGKQYQPSSTYGRPGANGMGGGMDMPGGGYIGTATSHVASFEVTTVVGPSLTNQFYAGGAYFSQIFNLKNPTALMGNPYSLLFANGSVGIPSDQTYGSSTYAALPFMSYEDPTYGGDFTKKQLRVAGDNVTKLIQRHTFRAGIYYQWDDNPQVSAQNTNGSLSDYYHPASFADVGGGIVYGTNNNTADLYEGIIGNISQVNKKVETNVYFWSLSGYIQDHWLIGRHMSIDGGVRLEHLTPWSDPHGQGVAIFDPVSYRSGAPLASPGVLYHAIDSSIPLTGVPTVPVFVEPRVGFVYDFRGDSKTIFRAGYGVYRQHDSYNDGLLADQTAEGQRTYTLPNSGHTFKNLNLLQSGITNATTSFVKDASINVHMASDDEMSRVQTYNVVLDQRFPHNVTMEVAYVGNYGDHLMEANNLRNINALPLGSLYGPEPNAGRADSAANIGRVWSIFTNGTVPTLSNLQISDTDSYRPYPLYSAINAIQHRGSSNYNGMQSQVTWFNKGVRLSANYTWSRALGVISGGDPTNLAHDYLPLSFDRTNIFNFTYSYSLGKPVNERYVGWVTNGWEVSGIVNYQSGTLLQSLIGPNFQLSGTLTVPPGTVGTIPGTTNTSTCTASGTPSVCTLPIGSGYLLGTPDIQLQPVLTGNPAGKQAHQYVDGSAFHLAPLGTQGQWNYGNLRGPAFFNTDMALRKEFKVRDKDRVQVRVAAFNFINRANYTFSNLFPGGYSMNFSQTLNGIDINKDLAASTNQNANFGSAPIRTGRRVMEVSVKYVF